jgi:hypothetical protein
LRILERNQGKMERRLKTKIDATRAKYDEFRGNPEIVWKVIKNYNYLKLK